MFSVRNSAERDTYFEAQHYSAKSSIYAYHPLDPLVGRPMDGNPKRMMNLE
jgi:hypothetical protein